MFIEIRGRADATDTVNGSGLSDEGARQSKLLCRFFFFYHSCLFLGSVSVVFMVSKGKGFGKLVTHFSIKKPWNM